MAEPRREYEHPLYPRKKPVPWGKVFIVSIYVVALVGIIVVIVLRWGR